MYVTFMISSCVGPHPHEGHQLGMSMGRTWQQQQAE